MTQSGQWIEGAQARSPKPRSSTHLSTISFLIRYPIFLLVFGPPVFRASGKFAGVDTSQAHFDLWSVIQVGWLSAIALRAIIRMCFVERVILSRRIGSVLKYPLFLGLVFVATIVYSPGRIISAEFSILYFLTLICVVEFLVDARQHPPDWMQFIFVFRRILLVLLGVVILWLPIQPGAVMGYVEGAGIRLSGGAIGPVGLIGPMVAIIAAFSFLNSLERRSKAATLFLIGVATTLVTQSRGVEIAFLLSLAILGFGWAKTGKRTAYLFLAGSMAAMLLVGLASAEIGPDRIWSRFNRGQDTADILTASGRTEMWASVIDYTLANPQGMGYIAGVRKFRGGRYAMNLHANLNMVGGSDNSYFDVLAGGGWLALGFYLMLLIKTAALGWHYARKTLVRLPPRDVATRQALRCGLLLFFFCLVEQMEGGDFVMPLRHAFYIQNVLIAVILGMSANMLLASRPRFTGFAER
jgi:hypothetical protein